MVELLICIVRAQQALVVSSPDLMPPPLPRAVLPSIVLPVIAAVPARVIPPPVLPSATLPATVESVMTSENSLYSPPPPAIWAVLPRTVTRVSVRTEPYRDAQRPPPGPHVRLSSTTTSVKVASPWTMAPPPPLLPPSSMPPG